MPIFFALLKQYWKPISVSLVLVFTFIFGYYKGYSHEKANFEKHLIEDARLTAIAKAENERKVQEAAQITADVTKDYNDEIAKIHDYYKSHPNVVRVCNAASSTGSVSAKGKDSSGASKAPEGATETIATLNAELAASEVKQCQLLIQAERELEGIK